MRPVSVGLKVVFGTILGGFSGRLGRREGEKGECTKSVRFSEGIAPCWPVGAFSAVCWEHSCAGQATFWLDATALPQWSEAP